MARRGRKAKYKEMGCASVVGFVIVMLALLGAVLYFI